MPGRLTTRLLPFTHRADATLDALPAFAVPADAISGLSGPVAFRETLLRLIAQARERILIVALYLQDDAAGREVLEALYAARARRPSLQISVLVDWHRAQRGLIGKRRSAGNAGLYQAMAQQRGDGVAIYGVPVHGRELFGVLHLKGFIVDDAVLYSGASVNDVYLAHGDRYRLDRYHLLQHAGLADAMADFLQAHLLASTAVTCLNAGSVPPTRRLNTPIRHLRRDLQRATYVVPHETLSSTDVAVTPLLGFGRSGNALDAVLLALLRGTRQRVILLTPYFNLPRPVRLVLGQLLRRGCTVDIMVGDKTANDFYLPPEQAFKTIGLLPYLYENNLRRFAREHRRQIDAGQLNLYVWRDGNNSYHLKGLFIDDDVAVLTGHNLNPRAWSLDLENALVLRDPARLLQAKHDAEWAALRTHATRLADYHALESPRHYPPEVRKLLQRLKRTQLDRLLNHLL